MRRGRCTEVRFSFRMNDDQEALARDALALQDGADARATNGMSAAAVFRVTHGARDFDTARAGYFLDLHEPFHARTG